MSKLAAFPGPTVGAMLVGGIVGASLVDSVNVVLMGYLLYDSFITHYGDPTIFDKPLWSLLSIVSFMVRGMYIKGVWHLSHEHPMITGALLMLPVFDFVCGILLSVKGFRVNAGETSGLKVNLYLEFASAILADGSVAGILLLLLGGTKTGNSRADSFGGRLMLFAVNTGLLTAVDATVALITYAAMPHNFVLLTPFTVLSRFYTNALFASLNSRTLGKLGDHVVSVNLSTVSPQRFPGSSIGTGPHGGQQLNIPIQTVVQTRVDESGSDN